LKTADGAVDCAKKKKTAGFLNAKITLPAEFEFLPM